MIPKTHVLILNFLLVCRLFAKVRLKEPYPFGVPQIHGSKVDVQRYAKAARASQLINNQAFYSITG
jgi:hypothetical protein